MIMRIKFFFQVIALSSFVMLNSCHRSSKNNTTAEKDAFYTDVGDFGSLSRIPLIKPYEAKLIHGNEWRIELETPQLLELSIQNVSAINVYNKMIFIYAKGSVSIKHIKYDEGWFIIIPEKNEEKGFYQKADFIRCLSELKIKEPHFYEINNVYQKFRKERNINWEMKDKPE